MNNKTCQNCKWFKDLGQDMCNNPAVLGVENKTTDYQRSSEGLCGIEANLWEPLPFSIRKTWLWRKLKR